MKPPAFRRSFITSPARDATSSRWRSWSASTCSNPSTTGASAAPCSTSWWPKQKRPGKRASGFTCGPKTSAPCAFTGRKDSWKWAATISASPPRIQNSKRWVLVAPPGDGACALLLARAADEEQASRIGNQAGGRVFLFLYTDNFQRDYERYSAAGVRFVREPVEEPYGTVAVFEDLYGNRWDLLEPKAGKK
ncbi:MAG: hypothetical protein EOO12_07655 [Chitinophagaceae bacterium]|nr:MAG: hypothetical protein EOO12_07655 [Chitinophagaceae bacterium]